MSLSAQRLAKFSTSPAAFRDHLILPSGRGPVRFADVVCDFQRRDFAALDPSLVALASGSEPPTPRFWLERTKGCSKDTDIATCILWLLAFARRALDIQIGAADKDQAAEIRKRCRAILRANPWLGEVVQIDQWRLSSSRNDSTCEIVAADTAGSHGSAPDLCVLNELTHIQKPEFASNLADNAAKVPHGVVIVATNAGFLGTWQEAWRETAESSDRWHFSVYDKPAPWLEPAEIDEAKQRNTTVRWERLFLGRWTSGQGEAIREDDIQAAVVHDGPMRGDEKGYQFTCGVDIGVSRDGSAVCVLGRNVGYTEIVEPEEERPRFNSTIEAMIDLGMVQAPPEPEAEYHWRPGNGKFRLADTRLWLPEKGRRVDIGEVENAILELHQRFRLARVCVDPFQAEFLISRLQRQGIPVEPTPFVPSALQAMATTVLDSFSNANIELYEHAELIQDLRNLKIEEKSYGVRLTAPRTSTGHGDLGTSLSLALYAARELTPDWQHGSPYLYGGEPLTCGRSEDY